jgi:hypothetical protein
MNRKRNSLGHEGGDVLKLGVRFSSGKWQNEWPRGLRFGFGFRFRLLRGVVGWWLWGSGNTLAVVGCFGYVLGWCCVCGKGVGLVGNIKTGTAANVIYIY